MNRNVFLLSAAFFFIFFSFSGAQQFVTSITSSAGYSDAGFWSLFLIYTTFALSSLPTAWIIERIGFRRAMIIGTLTYTIYITSLAVANVQLLLLSSILLGIGGAMLWVAQGECLVAIADREKIGEASGIFLSFWSVSSIASIILMGVILDHFVLFQQTMLWMLSLGPLVGGTMLLGIRSPKNWSSSVVSVRGALKQFQSLTLLRLSLIWFFMLAVAGFWLSTLSLLFVHEFGATQAGILGSLLTGIPVAVSFTLGKLSDQYGRKMMVSIGLLLCVASLIMFFSSAPVLLIGGAIFLSLGFAVLRVSTFAAVGDLSTQKNLLSLNSFLWTVSNFGVVFAVLIGWWKNGTAIPILVLIVLSLITFILAFPFLRMPIITIRKRIAEETT